MVNFVSEVTLPLGVKCQNLNTFMPLYSFALFKLWVTESHSVVSEVTLPLGVNRSFRKHIGCNWIETALPKADRGFRVVV